MVHDAPSVCLEPVLGHSRIKTSRKASIEGRILYHIDFYGYFNCGNYQYCTDLCESL